MRALTRPRVEMSRPLNLVVRRHVNRLAAILLISLVACDQSSESTDVAANAYDPDTDGYDVSIHDVEAEICFESVLRAAENRYEILSRVSGSTPGKLRWYQPSREERNRLQCKVMVCTQGKDGPDYNALPQQCGEGA
jgi:hypothetical protein